MKTNFLYIAILLMFWSGVAQGQNPPAREKIEAARIALITERLELTPDQAEKFWPIYNEYIDKNRDLHQQLKEQRGGRSVDELSEDERRELLQTELSLKQRRVELESEYSNRLLNVISSRQLLALRKAEDDFKRMILRQLQQRRAQRDLRQQRFQEYQERMEQRRNR